MQPLAGRWNDYECFHEKVWLQVEVDIVQFLSKLLDVIYMLSVKVGMKSN